MIADGQPRSSDDYEVDTAAGLRTFSVHIAAVAGIGATVTIADVTERAARERAWSYSATHDGVTRLPNRGCSWTAWPTPSPARPGSGARSDCSTAISTASRN